MILGLFAFFGLVSVVVSVIRSAPPDRKVMLYAEVTNAVSAKLKEPASAHFVTADEMAVMELAGAPGVGTGWVDSQNEMGALLRSRFRVEFKDTGKALAIRTITFQQP